ncbi:MAG: translation initiation factor IF-2 [Pseudomonadota bacterium]
MSDTKETTEKPARERKPLQLKRTVEAGLVQQKVGHGRANTVVVEKRTKRKVMAAPGKSESAEAKPARKRGGKGGGSSVKNPGGLSDSEMAARAQALAAAQLRAVEEEKTRAADAERRASEEAERVAREKAEADAEKKRLADEAIRKATDQVIVPQKKPAPSKAEEAPADAAANAASDNAPEPAAAPRPASDARPAARGTRRVDQRAAEPRDTKPVLDQPLGMTAPVIVTRTDRAAPKPPAPKADVDAPRRPVRTGAPPSARTDDDDAPGKRKVGGKPSRGAGRGEQSRVRGKLTISNALDERQRERSLASLRRKREKEKQRALGIDTSREKVTREVIIPDVITIQELANRMTERAVDVIKYLMKQGAMHKMNDVVDADTAQLIVEEFGHTSKRVSEADVEVGFITGAETDVEGTLEPRPPVVTIMGHVDHGKTSLLDALRETTVASGEAGGITQHIGAYQVTSPGGQLITFIDTPGHAAFTAMRARGAKVTDIVVLVVAADDGVMPQTIEAINHAKAAEVPIIVAINKMDKPDADPNRVRTELLQHEIVVESMSGDVLEIEVSALKRMNLEALLEAIALQAELLDLKANPKRSAEGFVIEAKLERGRGPVGTLLIQRGELAVGDIVVAGMSWGRVRALIDDKGKNTAKGGPSYPVEVLGFDQAPEAGDQFAVVENEARAREITEYRIRKRRETLGTAGSARTLEQMMQQLKEEGEKKEFPLVIKGDVQGSVEAIAGALQKLSTDEVEARVVHSGVGGITESDVTLANASNAVVIGFNTRANTQAKQAAEQSGIEVRYYNIIYDLVDDVKGVMSGMLAPTIREHFLGNAEIQQVFNITKVGKVAGCRVTEGKVERGAKVRLIRDGVVIHEGTLSMLKRFKDDAKEVVAGQECGMSFANYQDLKEGDTIECFQVEEVARTLD